MSEFTSHFIFLYTLANDSACTWVKEKLNEAGITFIEMDFSTLEGTNITEAPFLSVLENGTSSYYYTMDEIIEWIND